MDQHSPRPDDLKDQRSVEARRRMLRRSLGLASPVVLTLTSAPVSAGMCMSASAFVSVNTQMSRQPRGTEDRTVWSPTYWANSSYWPSGVEPTKKFHQCLGAHVLDHKAFRTDTKKKDKDEHDDNGQPTMLEVLACSDTVEAHVGAAWLNARRRPSLPHPFGDEEAIKEVWKNIRDNGGFYRPGNGRPAMTRPGTLKWLAQTWS